MTRYLFIDGGYLREAYRDIMKGFYGTEPDIAWPKVRGVFGNPDRIYYYDAVDRNRVGDETEDQTRARVKQRDEFHRYLNSLNNWHVREGFVSRGRRASRRSQKAVDVQLAVDALEHAVANNMDEASFVVGDLDFEPLFFSLTRFGISVSVYYEPTNTSDELLEAADIRSPLLLSTMNELLSATAAATLAVPQFSRNTGSPPPRGRILTGTWNGRQIEAYLTDANITIWAAPGPAENSCQVWYPSDSWQKAAQAFISQFGGEINWNT